jgi:sugar phosphate isomerase/epimerase
MKLGVSAIGWDAQDNTKIVCSLPKNIELLEIVPANRTGLFTKDLQVYSAQSLFWGVPAEDFDDDLRVVPHFQWLLEASERLGLQRLVLGSPGLRKGSIKGLLNTLKDFDQDFCSIGTTICIEPVARQYGGDYFFTVDEIVQSLKRWKFKAVKTMIDTNSIWMEGQCPATVLYDHFDYIDHVHISDKNIGPIVNTEDHINFASALKNSGYSQAVVRELLRANDCPAEYHLFSSIYGS